MPAVSAQNCALTEFLFRPNLSGVSAQPGVTLMTRKPLPAALELDRNDVALAMIMDAPRLRIDIHAQNTFVVNLHWVAKFFPADISKPARMRSRSRQS